MPRKRSAIRATAGTASPAATSAPPDSGQRVSLLERLRIDRARGFHTAERERLMASPVGRQSYAEAQRNLPLVERILLFERVVEEAQRAYRLQSLCFLQHARDVPAAAIALHKALLAPLIPSWQSATEQVLPLALVVDDAEMIGLRDETVRELRVASSLGARGNAREAEQHLFEARRRLASLSHEFAARRRVRESRLCQALAADLERRWPSAGALDNVTTKAFHDGVAAGEETQDLQAIARWLAPSLGQRCVEAGLDGTVIREVGNTLSPAGGGVPHLARVWPEQRAKIQVLADQAAARERKDAGDDLRHGPVFEWIEVRGERYAFFTDRQRRAVEMLWNAKGRPVHEDSIRDVVGAEDCDRFRMDHTFRHKGQPIPAWGKIILKAERGSRTYRLAR